MTTKTKTDWSEVLEEVRKDLLLAKDCTSDAMSALYEAGVEEDPTSPLYMVYHVVVNAFVSLDHAAAATLKSEAPRHGM